MFGIQRIGGKRFTFPEVKTLLDGVIRRRLKAGILMPGNIRALRIPAARSQEFNDAMLRFYLSKNGTEMLTLQAKYHRILS
jgi:hypothetical protein